MKISIVIPVFNDVHVGHALESILAQQHDHGLELVVVDAGSTDGTLDILEAYRDRITTLISEPDEGIFDGMNKGIRHATGDVVGILNADDQYHDPLVIRDVADVFRDDNTDAWLRRPGLYQRSRQGGAVLEKRRPSEDKMVYS